MKSLHIILLASEDGLGAQQKNFDAENDEIDDGVSYNDLTTLNYHPKPLAVS